MGIKYIIDIRMIIFPALLFATSLNCAAGGSNIVVSVVSKKCGNAEMSLQCTATGNGLADCLHPTLVYRSKSIVKKLLNPEGLKDSSPTGLACAVSKKNGTQYFHVVYGVLPTGCDVCEWHHLYDENGNLLTKSEPETIKIPNEEPAQSIAPNNQSFDKFRKDLNLGEYEDTDLVCKGPHVDAKGNLLCTVEIK